MSEQHSHPDHDQDHGHDHDHAHAHTHIHGHTHAPVSNSSAFAIGIALNITFVGVEVVYGLTAHSLALLSDAGHNLSDVFGLLIAWGAIHISKTLPTKRRTYGLRRSSILAALGNAIILLTVVGGIIWEAIRRFMTPEAVAGNTVMWVAAIGFFINTATALLFRAGRKSDINIKSAFLHMAGDAAVSVGVMVAGLIIHMTHWDWLDPVTSITVGLVIVFGTWSVLRESVNLAMDAVPEGIDPEAVENFLAALPGVKAVHDLHIWGMSTTEVALTAHLVMPQPPADDGFMHAIAHRLKDSFHIGHITVQIEHGTANMTCHQEPSHVV